MVVIEDISSSGDDMPKDDLVEKNRVAQEVAHDNGQPKQISTPVQDPIENLGDKLKALDIDALKSSEESPPEPLKQEANKDDKAQAIVIKPIEIEHNRDVRVSIVLHAGNNREIRPKMGIYSIEGKFLRPAKINKWAFVVMFDKEAIESIAKGVYTFDDIKGFAERYVQVGRSRGIQIQPLATIQCIPSQATVEKNVETMNREDLKEELRALFVKLNECLIDHAIIILPDNSPNWVHGYLQYLEVYKWECKNRKPAIDKLMRTSRIRLKTLIDLGIKSQDGGKKSLVPQIWLKYNTKLGGLNVALKRSFDTHDTLKFLNDGHLIISIDMCEHEKLESGSPRVAVAVGMWDLSTAQMSFHTETRVQARSASSDPSNLGAVEDLEQMVGAILGAYKQHKDSRLPSKVIVFRVGPYRPRTDDEFAVREVASIKAALRAAASEDQLVQTTLTYLKVPKKDKIRKYRDDTKEVQPERPSAPASQPSKSLADIVTAGSDLPLNRVEPPIRRNRPAERPRSHPVKLYDEAQMSNASVQAMIFALSFLSPRVTARTRLTPVDLADLAGERTHNILLAWMEDNKLRLEDGDFLERANKFLKDDLGDHCYKSNLYYA